MHFKDLSVKNRPLFLPQLPCSTFRNSMQKKKDIRQISVERPCSLRSLSLAVKNCKQDSLFLNFIKFFLSLFNQKFRQFFHLLHILRFHGRFDCNHRFHNFHAFHSFQFCLHHSAGRRSP